MARIQILELPMAHVGEYPKTPFAVIIDQIEVEEVNSFEGPGPVRAVAELTQGEADVIAKSIGAVGAVLTACTLDIA